MNDGQTVALAEPVSSQATGIVLVWRQFSDGSASKSNIVYQFVPKIAVAAYPGAGTSVFLNSGSGNVMAVKYVYVSDESISGYSSNSEQPYTTTSGVLLSPRNWVLTDVYGC